MVQEHGTETCVEHVAITREYVESLEGLPKYVVWRLPSGEPFGMPFEDYVEFYATDDDWEWSAVMSADEVGRRCDVTGHTIRRWCREHPA